MSLTGRLWRETRTAAREALRGMAGVADGLVKALGQASGTVRRRVWDPAVDLLTQMVASGGQMLFPGAWTADRKAQVEHFRLWVYVAVDAIASATAEQTPRVGFVSERKPPGSDSKRWLPADRRAKALSTFQPHEEIELAPSDHRLAQLFDRPNPHDTAWSFLYRTSMFLRLTGNFYWWVIRDGLGLPVQLYVLPSHWVWPRWESGPDGL